jgi:hypothetical protein
MQFNGHFFKQHDGLAMGAPTSAVLTETFIQCLEHTQIYRIWNEHQIIDYYRYVNDIIIIYNEQYTNIDNTLLECNSVHSNLKVTIEKETHNKIKYLDLMISKACDK